MKVGFKFAFSQIGLVGLVVGYVILGALIFMKIESSYELENQEKIEKNRDEFFDKVKLSAELMFNEYLSKNFHYKYNQYRNEEIEERMKKEGVFKDAYSTYHSNQFLNKINNTIYSINPNARSDTNDFYRRKIVSKRNNYNKNSYNMTRKQSWFIELDREGFSREIKNHLSTLFQENEKMEDKDQQTLVVREDVWNYPNALLYSATVITTIGEYTYSCVPEFSHWRHLKLCALF